MLRGHYNQHKRVPYEKLDWVPELPIFVITPAILENYGVEKVADVESHWHNSIEVLYTNESSSCVVVNGVRHDLHPHELFVINSQHVHSFPEVRCDYTGCTMQIEYQFAKEVLPDLDEVVFEVSPASQGYLLPIFQEVVRLYLEDERSNAEILLALMRALLLSLMKRTATYRTHKVRKAVRDNQVLLQVLGHLDACYQEDININQLANRCNISYAYLARLFKTNLGMSAKQYLTARRYERGRFLLETTDDSVTDIALAVGFPSASAFIREFKRRCGSTPEVFRRGLRDAV